jgi:hypothetical protein
VKTPAGAFLAGATSRLLPVSIPFRFFGAAIIYHQLAWLVLLAGAPGVPRFAGGLGWPLAGLHLVTLGVLVMTAIGASLQLLPVATRQPLRRIGWAAAVWWLYASGVGAAALGIGAVVPWLLGAGALAVALAMLAWAVLLANNLRGARGMPGVVWHGWAALGSLLIVLASALSLALAYVGAPAGLPAGVPLLDRGSALALHIAFALYGFMGLLGLGLSYILVPMFALAAAPDERQAVGSCALAIAALALTLLAAFGAAPQALRIAAVLLGMAALALHLRLMLDALRSGLRRELGRSFILVRVAWASLAASLVAALALQLGARWDGLPTLFGLLAIGGWLLTFVLGMLQRILPFLGSMHAARDRKRPATPSQLSADAPLALHFACHLAALGGLALAVLTDSAAIAALAAGIGALGAAAFAAFFLILLHRMRGGTPGRTPMA